MKDIYKGFIGLANAVLDIVAHERLMLYVDELRDYYSLIYCLLDSSMYSELIVQPISVGRVLMAVEDGLDSFNNMVNLGSLNAIKLILNNEYNRSLFMQHPVFVTFEKKSLRILLDNLIYGTKNFREIAVDCLELLSF